MLLAGGTLKNCRYKKCGKPFKSTKMSHVFCRRVCRTNYNSKIFYDRHLKRSPEIKQVRCKGCRDYIDISAQDNPPRKYCNTNCRTRKWFRDFRKKNPTPLVKSTRHCRMCPAVMVLTSRDKGRKRIYCSTRCRNAGNRQDRKEREREPAQRIQTGNRRDFAPMRVHHDDQPHRGVS